MNLLAMLIGALPMQRSTLDLFAVSVINILATPSIDVVPMLRASGDVYTIWTKVSTCIYFAFAIHLRIAGSVGFDDVVLMSRLRFNTPMLSARIRGARRTRIWQKWEQNTDLGTGHDIQEDDVGIFEIVSDE